MRSEVLNVLFTAVFSEAGAVPGIEWVLSVYLTDKYMDHSCPYWPDVVGNQPSAPGRGDHVNLGYLHWYQSFRDTFR